MGYITVSGDSNGDLHDAAMHNEKFGAIASVINGNIGRENLLYPNSEFLITCSGMGSNVGGFGGWYNYGTSSTSGVPVGLASTNGANQCHAPINSIIRIPFAGTITENVTAVILTAPSYNNAKNLTFSLQRASSPAGTYANIATGITDSCYSDPATVKEITFTGTSGQTIPSQSYLRLLIVNNDDNDYPPNIVMTIRMKTQHV